MTNLIAKVAELRELEAKATGDQWDSIGESISTSEMVDVDGEGDRFIDIPYDENDAEFIAALRNAAPELLAALGKVQAGDSEIIDDMATWFSCSDEPDQFKTQIDILQRYADLAHMMEGSP